MRRLIMIVEDSVDLRNMLGLALRSAGYEVTMAIHGQEALSKLAHGDLPSLILLDLMMPVMNGQEFLEARAKDPRISEVPVIVCSAMQDPAIVGFEYLKKPIELSKLTETVRRYVPL